MTIEPATARLKSIARTATLLEAAFVYAAEARLAAVDESETTRTLLERAGFELP